MKNDHEYKNPVAQKFALNIVIVLFSGLKFYLPNAQWFFCRRRRRRQMRGFNWELICIYGLLYSQCMWTHGYICMQCAHIKYALKRMRCTRNANCNKGKQCFIYIRCVNDMIVSNGEMATIWERANRMKEKERKKHINNHGKNCQTKALAPIWCFRIRYEQLSRPELFVCKKNLDGLLTTTTSIFCVYAYASLREDCGFLD